uniref:Sjogren's syndrome/scleroderma autoantigen 1 (Autoantigen p27) n=1 Tax=Elaeophora elaphi TaxID=1147741 RepID=A0A0R3RYF3_9BILA
MGHHQFDIISKSKSPETETDIIDQVTGMNLNGLNRITREQQQLLEQTRHRLRDRISSRMGELLLLGQTMLNEYCELCAGILMENRQGVRSCVACDMVNIELSRGQNDRLAVSNNDDLDDVVTQYGNVSRNSGVLQSSTQFLPADSSTRFSHSPLEREDFSVRTRRSRRLHVEEGISAHADFLGSRSVKTAVEAVEDKLRWCAERLKSCENVEEVMKLYETIDLGIGILKHFMST